MFDEVKQYLPTRLFMLTNILFWLALNTVSTYHSYSRLVDAGKTPDWYLNWLMYLPYWGNWILITPLVITLVRYAGNKYRKLTPIVLFNLGLMLFCMLLYWLFTLVQSTWLHSYGNLSWESLQIGFGHLIKSPMHIDMLVYGAVMCLGLTMNYYDKVQRQAIHNQKLANQLLKVELQSLKAQLSPHFLFNTLNTISGLIRLDQKQQAVSALSELSLMFRKVLENQSKQLTTLGEEMEFIHSYLAIQKLRFEKKLRIKVSVTDESLEVHLPFMLLHTLVENAVQHGSQLESDENKLDLEICTEKTMLHIRLTNKACSTLGHKGFGIGLKNCQQRLKHIYQDRYVLQSKARSDGYYETFVALPVGEASA